MAQYTVPAIDLFPDRPMSRYECYSSQYQRGVGKPFTQAERNAIFGKDRVKATLPNKPDPEWLTHPDWPYIAYAADGTIKRTSAEPAAILATTPNEGIGATPNNPEPIAATVATAPTVLECTQCGGHEVNSPNGPTPYCNECGGPAVPLGHDDATCTCDLCERARTHRASLTRAAKKTIMQGIRDAGYGAAIDSGHIRIVTVSDPAPTFPVRMDRSDRDPEPETAPCPRCDTPAEPGDKFCGQCGNRLDAPTQPVARIFDKTAPSPEELYGEVTGNWPGYVPIEEKYSGKNPARIYDAMPSASDVRGFHDWLKAGRCVRKGQHGILIYVPAGYQTDDAEMAEESEYRRPRVKKAYVFDISQTDVLAPKDAAAITPAERPAKVAAVMPANVTPFPQPTEIAREVGAAWEKRHAAIPAALMALRAADI